MNIYVQFLGGFHGIVPETEFCFTLQDNANLRTLIEELAFFYGRSLLDCVLSREGDISQGVAILINGTKASLKRGLGSRLDEGDCVTFLPVVEGWC